MPLVAATHMTLDGLTVEEWLRVNETACNPTPDRPSDAAQDGPSATWTPRVARIRSFLTWFAAIAAGAWLAAPAFASDVSCPPSGEGATYCHLQHNVLQATMTFLLVAAGVVIACRLAFGLPKFVVRVRREGWMPRPPSAADYGDRLLIAASRGHVV